MKALYAFALGVALTGLFAWGYGWSVNYRWELECYEHGVGFFYIKDITKPSLEYRWYPQLQQKGKQDDKIRKRKRSRSII